MNKEKEMKEQLKDEAEKGNLDVEIEKSGYGTFQYSFDAEEFESRVVFKFALGALNRIRISVHKERERTWLEINGDRLLDIMPRASNSIFVRLNEEY